MSNEPRIEKFLGKITDFEFGITGYQDAMLGYNVVFSFDTCSSVNTSNGFWDCNLIKHTKGAAWDEARRDEAYAKIMRDLSDILKAAKVKHTDQLIGKPVEITYKNSTFSSWRILEEVL